MKIIDKIKCLFKPKTVLVKNDDGEEFRFKVHKGNQIWLAWIYPFPLEMKENGVLICKVKGIPAYNKPYEGWTWRPDDYVTECPNADY